ALRARETPAGFSVSTPGLTGHPERAPHRTASSSTPTLDLNFIPGMQRTSGKFGELWQLCILPRLRGLLHVWGTGPRCPPRPDQASINTIGIVKFTKMGRNIAFFIDRGNGYR